MAAPTVWKTQTQVNADDSDLSADPAGYDQRAAKIVGLANGGFVVAWADGGDRLQLGAPDIVGQYYDALGKPVGGETILSFIYNDDAQIAVDLAAFSDGSFITAYETTDAAGFGDLENVTVERYGADRSFQNFNDFRGPANDTAPSVTTFADGSYALVYQDDESGSTDLNYVYVAPDGTAAAGVDIATGAGTPDIAALTNGNVVVAYERGGDVALKVVTAAGGAVASATVAATAATETGIVVAALPGGFVAAWSDGAGDVSFALYSNAGVRTAGPSDANLTTTAGVQDQPAVVALGDGGFVIAWRDAATGDVQGQRFDQGGVASGGEVTLLTGGDCEAPQLALLADGRFAVTADILAANGSRDVVSAIWDPREGPITGTAGDDVLTGQLAGATIDGLGGADMLYGAAAADTLDGGTGADTMTGGAGSDTYYVDNAGDRVIETNVAGVDQVFSTVTFSLAGQFAENLTLTGAGDIDATGNTLKNALTGNSGANVLNGGANADVMTGGAGSDTYYVDNAGDRVIEANVTGVDQVFSTMTFSLAGQFAENLTLTGTADIDATGNTLKNALTGNSGANVLNGGANADVMAGGAGADTYYVDNAGDRVIEANVTGVDQVFSTVTFSLAGQFAENLTLTGTGDIDATGNTLKNALTGNSGANVLNGGANADVMAGGAGADTYYVDNAGDRVVEANVTGVDQVFSTVTFSLAGQFAENLTLTGTAAVDATGNTLKNTLTGNGAANVLNGGAGADILFGGAGADVFVFSTALGASNVDRVTDFSHADDTIRIDHTVFAGLSAGALPPPAFWSGAGVTAAHDATDRIIYDTTSGALFFDRDGSGATYAAVQFATLTTHPADVDRMDFTIV